MDVLEQTLLELVNWVKTTSPEVWRVIIKQQIFKGLNSLAVGILFAILGIFGVSFLVKFFILWGGYNDGTIPDTQKTEDKLVIYAVSGFLLTLFGLGIGLSSISSGINLLYNPEYFAIQEFLSFIP